MLSFYRPFKNRDGADWREADSERDVGCGGAKGLAGGSPGGTETQRKGRRQGLGGGHAL